MIMEKHDVPTPDTGINDLLGWQIPRKYQLHRLSSERGPQQSRSLLVGHVRARQGTYTT